jgi:hypothetical protein
MNMAADLDWIAPAPVHTRQHDRPPSFKIDEAVQTAWRVRLPSASATRSFGFPAREREPHDPVDDPVPERAVQPVEDEPNEGHPDE